MDGNHLERQISIIRRVTGLNFPDELFTSLLTCFLSDGHLIVNLNQIQSDGELVPSALYQLLCHFFPFQVSQYTLTPHTKPEDLFGDFPSAGGEAINAPPMRSWGHSNSSSFSQYGYTSTPSQIVPQRPHKGPIFAPVFLACSVDAASENTLNALLDAMVTRRVAIHGNVYSLPDPFMVICTTTDLHRIPIQLRDHFLVTATLPRTVRPTPTMSPSRTAFSAQDLEALHYEMMEAYVDGDLERYMRDLVVLLRNHPKVLSGASPRCSMSLARAVRANALLKGRRFAVPADIDVVATQCLAHRFECAPDVAAKHVILELIRTMDALV